MGRYTFTALSKEVFKARPAKSIGEKTFQLGINEDSETGKQSIAFKYTYTTGDGVKGEATALSFTSREEFEKFVDVVKSIDTSKIKALHMDGKTKESILKDELVKLMKEGKLKEALQLLEGTKKPEVKPKNKAKEANLEDEQLEAVVNNIFGLLSR